MSKLGAISEYKTFLKEFRATFHTTGAVLPSSKALARAMVRPLEGHTEPIRVLEVGPGTGAITRAIVQHIGPNDHLDIVELNERFVDVMRKLFLQDPAFVSIADRSKVHHMPVQQLRPEKPYDFIISGLPMNNFSSGLVREVMRHMVALLKPGGLISYYEYLGLRRIRRYIGHKEDRVRLARVERVLQRYLKNHELRCDRIWVNFPPAVARHLRVNPIESTGKS